MKLIFFMLALLGSALAINYPVEYRYLYNARVGTGIQSGRPQYSATGIRAQVKITMQREGEGLIEMSQIEVGEKNEPVKDNGRAVIDIAYHPIHDQALTLPYKAFFRRKDGQTVMEVPRSDLLWVTNVRRGVVNFFRIAPLVDPASVHRFTNLKTNSFVSGSLVEPQAFSRMEDTHAGRCQVSYSIARSSQEQQPKSLNEDVQSQESRQFSAGQNVKLEESFYRVVQSIDFSLCSERVALMQTGAGNLANITDSTFRDVSARSYVSSYILKGSPGMFRIESGVVESQFILNPYGMESDKMVIISNQTMVLLSTRMSSGQSPQPTDLKPVTTWMHNVQSPNQRPQGYAPPWITYKPENEGPHSPIFYERFATGFKQTSEMKAQLKRKAMEIVKQVSQRLQQQNQDSREQPAEYKGTQDGRLVQDLYVLHKLLRTLPYDALKELYTSIEQQGRGSNCHQCLEIYIDALAVAGSGSSLHLLLEMIKLDINQAGAISEKRTASIFFNIANNIQSPEMIVQLRDYVMSIEEEQHTVLGLLTKINFSILARRLCVSPAIQTYSHMRYLYGDKMCSKDAVIPAYLQHLEQKIKKSDKLWVKILNVQATAELGAREGLTILSEVARGEVDQSNKLLRIAAIHGMASRSFDDIARDQIIEILLPIAESQVEHFSVREAAYDIILTWRPNATFFQRMAFSSSKERSKQMQSYIYGTMRSIASIEDPSYKPMSNVARMMLPLTQYLDPSLHRSLNYITSKYLSSVLIGSYSDNSWYTHLRDFVPRELYSYLSAQYGGFSIPLIETVSYGNNQAAYVKIRDFMDSMNKQSGRIVRDPQTRRAHETAERSQEGYGSASDEKTPDLFLFLKLWRTSEVFMPLTNDIYGKIASNVPEMLSKLKETERLVLFKYMNPVEAALVLPTPTGLFVVIEVTTPTMLYGDFEVTVVREQSSQVPSLGKIRIVLDGQAKAVTKTNTLAYLIAPWSNKTIISSVDNEKSFALPMKYELEVDLSYPHKIIWGAITPKFQPSATRVPILSIRNMPYTAIAAADPVAEVPRGVIDFKKVIWSYPATSARDERMHSVTYPIRKDLTGLKLDVIYNGEVIPPFQQPSIITSLILQPTRLLSLLASPTIKNYDLGLYIDPSQSTTKKIGFSSRLLQVQGSSNAPQIRLPESAHQPIDVSLEDNQQQRIIKLQQFSNQQNTEYSLQLNFTGSQVYKYEISVMTARLDSASRSQADIHTLRKIQVVAIQKNEGHQQERKTGVIAVIARPHLEPLDQIGAILRDPEASHFKTSIEAQIITGPSFSKQQQHLAVVSALLTISEKRVEELKKLTEGGQSVLKNSDMFYRYAVYDQLHLDASWTDVEASTLRNYTLMAKDLVEGYLFPHVVKNHLVENQPMMMKINAIRSISDDRAEAWVHMPEEIVHVEMIRVFPLFDWIAGFTTEVRDLDQRSFQQAIKSDTPSDSCVIEPTSVKTFDGVTYSKSGTTCLTLVAAARSQLSAYKVLTRMTESRDLEVQTEVSNNKIVVSGRVVKVNGIQISEPVYVVRDQSGNIVAKVIQSSKVIKVILSGKIELSVYPDSKSVLVKVDRRYKNDMAGLCGDFNSEPSSDLRGPQMCIYPSSKGALFSASWLVAKNSCQDSQMQSLIRELPEFQKTCRKTVMGSRIQPTDQECIVRAHPVFQSSSLLCATEQIVEMCKSECNQGDQEPRQMRSKCWDRAHAPQQIINNLQQGYVVDQVPQTPQYVIEKIVYIPLGCYKPARQ